MNEQTCCFSGHRHLPKQETLHIHNLLVKHILKLIHIGVNTFICGGALGFDTLAALAVLKIRSIYPHIQLILALPSPQQTNGWSSNDIAVYQSILKQAIKLFICLRNITADVCICVITIWWIIAYTVFVTWQIKPVALPTLCNTQKRKTDTFLILPMNHNLFENNIIKNHKRQPFDSCLL